MAGGRVRACNCEEILGGALHAGLDAQCTRRTRPSPLAGYVHRACVRSNSACSIAKRFMSDGVAPSVGDAVSARAPFDPTAIEAVALTRPRLATVRTFLLYASPFVFSILGYETLRKLLPARRDVHVGDLYELEARLFSVPTPRGPVALSELIARHPNALLDFVCGAAYLAFVAEVLLVAGLLFLRDRHKMLELSLSFLAVNALGWLVWWAYPAAPPWYVDAYGTGPVVLEAASSPAGLARFDALLGTPIAHALYSKSANVFGAMPSLHVAYVTLAACAAYAYGGRLRAFTLGFAACIAFSAVYLRHHYLLDVLAGALLAFATWKLVATVMASWTARQPA
jgi:inositol phosphorylceramide synthase catalytic subunit